MTTTPPPGPPGPGPAPGPRGGRPVGWWLKEADAALDAAFDAALAGSGTDRRGWQLLASLARGPASAADLRRALAAFDPPDVLDAAVERLRSRGWVDGGPDGLRLTDAGTQAHGHLAPRAEEVRARVARALPPEDYRTLVTLLERLVDGLRPT